MINGGAIDGVNPAGLNVRETYSITLVKGDRRTGTRSASHQCQRRRRQLSTSLWIT